MSGATGQAIDIQTVHKLKTKIATGVLFINKDYGTMPW